ncbi:MAG: DUF2252 domain-containing protein [Amaricoccus sp.]
MLTDPEALRLLGLAPRERLLSGLSRPRPSAAERREAGRALRGTLPRSALGKLALPDPRPDPVAMIEAENATRVASLVPLRNARMVASPFAFLRGTAGVMASDLSAMPRTGIDVMAGGDMHLANFGLFASAERHLIFAINDFDEVHPGPWEWDLKRLAASAAVVADFLGGGRAEGERAARAAALAYAGSMRRLSEMGFLEVWYDLIGAQDILAALPPELEKPARRLIDRARRRGHLRSLDKLSEEVDGQWRIAEDPPLVVRETALPDGTPLPEAMEGLFAAYLVSLPEASKRTLGRYRLVDVARKVVGVGSVGTSCWVGLFVGADGGDPLFLQVKEAGPSVLARYVAHPYAGNEGRRVVMGQRMIQGSPDIFLGWGPSDPAAPRHFYVRQLADMKGGVRFLAGDRGMLRKLPDYAALCGRALALAHAKSGDPAMISGYCGRGEALADALAAFALAYAERAERDHAAFAVAVRSGRVPVEG